MNTSQTGRHQLASGQCCLLNKYVYKWYKIKWTTSRNSTQQNLYLWNRFLLGSFVVATWTVLKQGISITVRKETNHFIWWMSIPLIYTDTRLGPIEIPANDTEDYECQEYRQKTGLKHSTTNVIEFCFI